MEDLPREEALTSPAFPLRKVLLIGGGFLLIILLTGGVYYLKTSKTEPVETTIEVSNEISPQKEIGYEPDISSVKYTKRVSLIVDERRPPPTDPNYVLRSSNIRIGTPINENEDYDEAYIYLRFDNAIEGNESLENFRKYLQPGSTVVRVALTEISIPAESDDIPKISTFDRSVRENLEINITNYDNGRLKGTLTTIAKEASYWVQSDDPDCIVDDMVGICVRTIPVEVNLIIDFEVQVK